MQKKGTPGFEPGTIRTAAECSTTELRTLGIQTSLLPGFEPGLPDSRSGVLTTTLQELLLLIILLPAAGAFSSVVERPFCIRKVEGSNPSSSIRHILHADSQQREAPMQAREPLSSVAEHRSRKPGVESSILSVAFVAPFPQKITPWVRVYPPPSWAEWPTQAELCGYPRQSQRPAKEYPWWDSNPQSLA